MAALASSRVRNRAVTMIAQMALWCTVLSTGSVKRGAVAQGKSLNTVDAWMQDIGMFSPVESDSSFPERETVGDHSLGTVGGGYPGGDGTQLPLIMQEAILPGVRRNPVKAKALSENDSDANVYDGLGMSSSKQLLGNQGNNRRRGLLEGEISQNPRGLGTTLCQKPPIVGRDPKNRKKSVRPSRSFDRQPSWREILGNEYGILQVKEEPWNVERDFLQGIMPPMQGVLSNHATELPEFVTGTGGENKNWGRALPPLENNAQDDLENRASPSYPVTSTVPFLGRKRKMPPLVRASPGSEPRRNVVVPVQVKREPGFGKTHSDSIKTGDCLLGSEFGQQHHMVLQGESQKGLLTTRGSKEDILVVDEDQQLSKSESTKDMRRGPTKGKGLFLPSQEDLLSQYRLRRREERALREREQQLLRKEQQVLRAKRAFYLKEKRRLKRLYGGGFLPIPEDFQSMVEQICGSKRLENEAAKWKIPLMREEGNVNYKNWRLFVESKKKGGFLFTDMNTRPSHDDYQRVYRNSDELSLKASGLAVRFPQMSFRKLRGELRRMRRWLGSLCGNKGEKYVLREGGLTNGDIYLTVEEVGKMCAPVFTRGVGKSTIAKAKRKNRMRGAILGKKNLA